jgi:hypothetical protein
LLQLFDDGDKMPPSWKEWMKMAEEMEQGLKAYGHVVLRVYIDPATFPDWCAAHGNKPRQRRTQKVRRGSGNREIWPIGRTGTVLAGRRPIASPASEQHVRPELPLMLPGDCVLVVSLCGPISRAAPNACVAAPGPTAGV